MIPKGYIPSDGEQVTLDEPFAATLDLADTTTFVSTYISVYTTAGNIAYVNAAGVTRNDYGFVGRNPIAATKVLTAGTTAAGLYFSGSPTP